MLAAAAPSPRLWPRRVHPLSAATLTHSLSLYRLLRALAAIGVFHEQPNRTFSLTALGESLRSDIPSSKNAWARLVGRPMYYQAWSGLLDSLRTGEPAFNKVHGVTVWDFRAERPDETAAFDWAMAAIADQTADAVLSVSDFSRYSTVVDVGGGRCFHRSNSCDATHNAGDTFRSATCNRAR
jgi:hypothetical protein